MTTACRRTFRCFIRAVSWIPVIFVSLLIAWAYYVYVYVMNISGAFPKGSPTVSALVSALLLLVGHILLCLQLSSFFRTICTRHKPIPEEFLLTDEQMDTIDDMVDSRSYLEELATDLPIHTLGRNGSVRYCEACMAIKPDRAHHCSLCNTCVLKMDHHCPWVNNCVGYSNYKFFVLFLFYTAFLALWIILTGSYDFYRAWGGTLETRKAEKFNVIFCYFVCALFGLSTSCLFFFHVYLTLFNRTTIENMQAPVVAGGPDRRLYHLGFLKNVQLVFGRNILKALLPLDTSEGDGASFQTRIRTECELGVVRNGPAHPPSFGEIANGPTVSGDESEVEMFAAGDLERQPLTRTTEL